MGAGSIIGGEAIPANDIRGRHHRPIARVAIDPAARSAEFALIVGREIGGQGLGTFLLRRLIEYSRRRRMQQLWGDVRDENANMLAVCDELGFTRSHTGDEPGTVRVKLAL